MAFLRDIKSLRSLDLGGCGRVTDAGVASLGSLPVLTDISVKYCVGVTGRGLEQLRQELPNIRITHGA